MKYVLLILGLMAANVSQAQDLTEADKTKIKDGLKIEIKEINRVEKYGWDNLEVIYDVENATDFNIQKLDFTVTLLDEQKSEVGTVEVHAFRIPKGSERNMKYADVGSAFVNTKFQGFSTQCTMVDVIVEGDEGKIVSIEGSELASR